MIILDSTFLVKLVLQEPNSGEARRLTREWITRLEPLATLDIAVPEALDAIQKHATETKDLTRREAIQATADLKEILGKIKQYQAASIAVEALGLAIDECIPVNNALYIQLAKNTLGKLATYDYILREQALEHGVTVLPTYLRDPEQELLYNIPRLLNQNQSYNP